MPAKKTTILVADDDPQILRLITRNLQLEGYEVLSAADGVQALEQIEARMPDLVVLDIKMPKMDGLAVCAKVREFSSVPILMLTSLGQDVDKVRGLDAGADDYLTKPFSLDELFARVRAVLRRGQFSASDSGQALQATATIGDLTIDFRQHAAFMAGQELPLTPIEYALLAYLAQHVGRVALQDQILEHVWGPQYLGESHMLQVNVNRLRRKLEPDAAHPCYLLTKVGVGYLLSAHPAS
jgi:DNA-binding response OmpR family regulator